MDGIDVDKSMFNSKRLPQHLAAERNDVRFILLQIDDCRFDLGALDWSGYTCLQRAVCYSRYSVVSPLLTIPRRYIQILTVLGK
jgi:ankyrin repeat protein